MELHKAVVVQRYCHLPIVPYELAMGQKFEKIWYKLGPDIVKPISLKPLDWFLLF